MYYRGQGPPGSLKQHFLLGLGLLGWAFLTGVVAAPSIGERCPPGVVVGAVVLGAAGRVAMVKEVLIGSGKYA